LSKPFKAVFDMTELVGISALLLVFLTILLAGGVWIAMALMATGYVGMQFIGGGIPSGPVLATTIWGNSNSWTLAALPLFIWMGEILFRTKLSDEMFRGLAPWLNKIPGRLMHVNVLACGIFGSVSGSSAATCATVAKIALPELKKRGYDEMVSLGSLAGAGTLGILIPPSITMVVYAVAANVSIIQIFLAGFLPGFLVMVLYSGYIAGWSLAHPEKTPPAEPVMTFREKVRESRQLIPLTLLILLVFLSLMVGWATATECAAWGVMGSLAIAWWHDALTWDSFWASVMGTVRVNCMIMLILAGASYMSTSMAYTGIPATLATWVDSFHLSPYALIAALTVMYIVLGTALDGISMIVLTTSIVVPMIKQAGFDLVWFGIFVVLVVEMAEVSPPVGFNLFVLQTMSGKDSNTVARASLPFFFLLVVAVAIITVFPDIVMVLPRWVFPG
jgi:tripartite ATP-independent transporter DctM subunit